MRTNYLNEKLQRGAAALILVLLVLLTGTAVMFSGISAQEFKIERDKQTSRALAEAKQAIIAWSVRNATPGQLPCPEDTNKIGFATEGEAMTTCNTLSAIGRLPWKTLGLGDLRDGNGDRLWYAISSGFRTSPINSDSLAQLTVDGQSNAAVAIVFSPGSPIGSQSRTQPTNISPPNVGDYLDITNNDGDNIFISQPASATFNDKILTISHTEFFSAVERRVLREAKNCLDDYAALSSGKYPWAVPVSQVPPTTGSEGTRFGRIPLNLSITVSGTPDSTMIQQWSSVPSCTLFYPLTTYWYANNWRELVFYQLSSAYQPNLSLPPYVCGGNCLSINGNGNSVSGSGSYHAVLLISGGVKAGHSRVASVEKADTTNYLEEDNIHVNPSPSLIFEAYRYKDMDYNQVNDQAICLDAKVNCK